MSPSHTHAAILSIGDELIRGQALDTNSRLLSQKLMDLGIEPVEHATIGDDRAATAAAIRRLAQSAPLVIITGGLGPTEDDLTREALADVLGESLVEDGGWPAISSAIPTSPAASLITTPCACRSSPAWFKRART